ncbi:MAG: 50S ribosomal protein L20 [uncultured bacterium]|uniref:Large ribosomal subunit protein bL20 n=1 Tax=Candidatus Daviesbacteria bacterium GW2011_GWC2_40_12 TaxID=1618431 RepID=A0A0G0T1R9_9BACT|nr:MAG: 50S ribosomal protein L20 [uncultured bacterium]KKR16673.1 MAG: 50S ribosomal protein L20 [Candidatus Daviesbacteria bacterium GW2011_GWA2_39_33]KKR25139.1 MAG: 50S ribosomal protein L20 [Candidatus Daviesbacteria bacterium GW2011_GWB1_39_5]KKR41050.1 MAG: 50S ribosomal protein L20 [Candidatus Daviesbacteria bacterium GW2011_GWC2_40_12]OGE21223.1 MAG: 50S ribosomal protein L20 [Candidatus Daviesbacteria bacterium RIFCSPHIGHO2_01_FULL_40_24]OGE28511.1 MAG: 50S ribosomal protein L20 [Can
MARVKRGVVSHRKHKKVLKLTKGHIGGRSKLIRQAKSSLLHAGEYAFAGRKLRKRDMRRLWITQMGIALKNEGLSYSKFMAQLKTKNINLDRKVLSDLAVNHIEDFKKIISEVK